MTNVDVKRYDRVFNRFTNSKEINEGIMLIENTNGDYSFDKEYGGMSLDSPFIMASITKLFTTTCILILLEHKKLSLDDKVSKYIDDCVLARMGTCRIVHGVGTGKLRSAVHDLLRKHKMVDSFALASIGEGGAGATRVVLKQ